MLTSRSQTWDEAQAEARSRGGNLVTINDAAEEAWLKQTFGQSEMWIGINDAAVDGQFEWASGEAVTYTNWAPGEPNNWRGDQDYGSMNFGSTQQWDDNGVSARFRGVIELSEDDPVTEPEPLVYNGKEYSLTSTQTWVSAQAEARRRGGNLVTVNDAAEEAWLKGAFGSEALWIGINDAAVDGQFRWASGEAVTYTNWAPGEPNNWQGDQDYGSMNFSATRQWDDNGVNAVFRGIVEVAQTTQPPTSPDNPGGIALDESIISVDEDAGSVRIDVVRSGGSDGTVTVDYRTQNNGATSGADYQERIGTLTFGSGETVKSVQVPIVNDEQAEGDEIFNFAIDNPGGGAGLLAPRTAQITIRDDDDTAPTLKSFRGNDYVLTSAKSWEAAQAEAQQRGGNLVTINSAEEEAWMKQKL